MNETMILPIKSPPPSQAVKPAENNISTGPSFEDILRAHTEMPESKPVTPARSTHKDSASTSSTETAKSDPSTEDSMVEKPEGKEAKPPDDAAAAAAIAVMQTPAQVVQPVVVQPEQTQLVADITVDAAVLTTQLVAETPVETAAPAPAPTQTGETQATTFEELVSTVEPQTASQPMPKVETPVETQSQPSLGSESAIKNQKPDVEPAQAETKSTSENAQPSTNSSEVKPQVTVETNQPQGTNKHAETEASVAASTSKTTAAESEQEVPKQVQAPPGNSHPEVTGVEGKTTTATQQTTEPARLAEAQTSDMIGQITRQMDQMSQSGRTTIRMQLFPNELGQIDLKITTTSQGVGISILAENANTGKLLETQVAQLRQTLMDAGVQITNMHVGTQAGQQQQFAGAQTPFAKTNFGSYRTSSDAAEPEEIREVRSRNTLVDYKV